jgi:hypothetical protein
VSLLSHTHLADAGERGASLRSVEWFDHGAMKGSVMTNRFIVAAIASIATGVATGAALAMSDELDKLIAGPRRSRSPAAS